MVSTGTVSGGDWTISEMSMTQKSGSTGKKSTRARILTTFARMVVEDGLNDVTMQQVADRAGVTHRTVYRYFESREDLINQLGHWLDEQGQETGLVQAGDTVDDLPEAVMQTACMFDQYPELVTALVRVTWYTGTPAEVQLQRTAIFEEQMRPVVDHLRPEHARAVIALTRILASSRIWLMLREEFGLSGEESGPVVALAIERLIQAVRDPALKLPTGCGQKGTR
jgi:AcrR family transcriptional regulator